MPIFRSTFIFDPPPFPSSPSYLLLLLILVTFLPFSLPPPTEAQKKYNDVFK